MKKLFANIHFCFAHRWGICVALVAILSTTSASSQAQLDVNKLLQAKEVAIQVQNTAPGIICVVVDNTGRGDNVVPIARADGAEPLKGIRIEPGQEGTIRHGANLGDAPTIHVWEIKDGRATHELLANPPPWWTANYDGGVKVRSPLRVKWDGQILSER